MPLSIWYFSFSLGLSLVGHVNPLCIVFCPREGKKQYTIQIKYHAAGSPEPARPELVEGSKGRRKPLLRKSYASYYRTAETQKLCFGQIHSAQWGRGGRSRPHKIPYFRLYNVRGIDGGDALPPCANPAIDCDNPQNRSELLFCQMNRCI